MIVTPRMEQRQEVYLNSLSMPVACYALWCARAAPLSRSLLVAACAAKGMPVLTRSPLPCLHEAHLGKGCGCCLLSDGVHGL